MSGERRKILWGAAIVLAIVITVTLWVNLSDGGSGQAWKVSTHPIAVPGRAFKRCFEAIGSTGGKGPVRDLAICDEPAREREACFERSAGTWVHIPWNKGCDDALREFIDQQ